MMVWFPLPLGVHVRGVFLVYNNCRSKAERVQESPDGSEAYPLTCVPYY